MKRTDGWTCVFNAGDRCAEVHRGLLHFCLSPAVLLKILSSIMPYLTSLVWLHVTVPGPDNHIFPHWITKPSFLGLSFNRYQIGYHSTELKFRYLFSSQVPVISHTWLGCHLVSPWNESSLDFSGAACNPWLAVSLFWFLVPMLCVSLATKHRGKNWMAAFLFCKAMHLMHKYRSCWKNHQGQDCRVSRQGSVSYFPSLTAKKTLRGWASVHRWQSRQQQEGSAVRHAMGTVQMSPQARTYHGWCVWQSCFNKHLFSLFTAARFLCGSQLVRIIIFLFTKPTGGGKRSDSLV